MHSILPKKLIFPKNKIKILRTSDIGSGLRRDVAIFRSKATETVPPESNLACITTALELGTSSTAYRSDVRLDGVFYIIKQSVG